MPDTGNIEREIEACFEKIAGSGWFAARIANPEDSTQLRLLHELISARPGMRILDAGCARGRFLREISGARLFGVDLTAAFLRDARRNVPDTAFTRASLRALPFADGSFDFVYCIETLQHLPDTGNAVRELARVLKPGGTLLIMDRNLSGLHPRWLLPAGWVKHFEEWRGRWMYPPGLGFQERWFHPPALTRELKKYCGAVTVRFVTEGHGRASRLYRLFPLLSCDAAWIATK